MMLWWTLGGLLAVASSGAGADRSAVTPAPDGSWAILAMPDRCAVARRFNQDGMPLLLRLVPPIDASRGMDVELEWTDADRKMEFGVGRIRDQTAAENYELQFAVFPTQGSRRLFQATIRARTDALRTATRWSIRGHRDVNLDMTGLDATLPQLRDCQLRLLRDWGVEPSTQDAVSLSIERDDKQYIRTDDYPVEAMRRAVFGRITAVLQARPDGAVTACRIVRSAGPLLDGGSCTVLRRLRLPQISGADGKPRPYAYAFTINWVLPPT